MFAEPKSYMDFVLEIDEKLNQEEHIFIYDGFVDQEVTKFFSNQVKEKMDREGCDYLLANRVYHIMIECFQNILRHSNDPITGDFYDGDIRGFLSVGSNGTDYFVTTGNFIYGENLKNLSEKIEMVNSLDREGVKKLYKDTLKENRLNDRGGAGLGFIDMRKRTNNLIHYKSKKINDKTHFVVLFVTVSGGASEE